MSDPAEDPPAVEEAPVAEEASPQAPVDEAPAEEPAPAEEAPAESLPPEEAPMEVIDPPAAENVETSEAGTKTEDSPQDPVDGDEGAAPEEEGAPAEEDVESAVAEEAEPEPSKTLTEATKYSVLCACSMPSRGIEAIIPFAVETNADDIIQKFASKHGLLVDEIVMRYKGNVVRGETTLKDLGAEIGDALELDFTGTRVEVGSESEVNKDKKVRQEQPPR